MAKTIIIKKDDLKEKVKWEALMKEIMAGNVIPVIGPDFLIENDTTTNLHKYLIDSIAEAYEVDSAPTSFSQLIFDKKFEDGKSPDSIYPILHDIFEQNSFEPSDLLKRLLKIKKFPFIITTTFSPIIEDAMREIWGDIKIRTLVFSNNPNTTNVEGLGDIHPSDDLTSPTVYYMFGKVSPRPHEYVVSDTDMLNFCQSWLTDGLRPKNLSAKLRGKYLLVLGSDYSDWLFRFIWYSITNVTNEKAKGMVVNNDTPDTLVAYLTRLDTFLPKNKTPLEIINEIETRIAAGLRSEEDTRFDNPKRNTDVFISYSRTDSVAAARLYETLTARGLNVWYDRKNLPPGNDFMHEIENAIRTTKLFIPIISDNIDRERNNFHVYRIEWNTAINMQNGMGQSRNFILPVSQKNFDFYKCDIPEGIKSHNALEYDEALDFSHVADAVIQALNAL